MVVMAEWFDEGLRFTCTRCGNCCTGAPGFVSVNEVEIGEIAAFRSQSVAEFRRQCVHTVGSIVSLVERRNGDCVFFDATRGCTVYPVRPRQCRTWPFWNSNLRTPEHWRRTCAACPGAGKGRLYSPDEITRASALIDV